MPISLSALVLSTRRSLEHLRLLLLQRCAHDLVHLVVQAQERLGTEGSETGVGVPTLGKCTVASEFRKASLGLPFVFCSSFRLGEGVLLPLLALRSATLLLPL